MTKADQEALVEYGRNMGHSVFPVIHDGALAIQTGCFVTTDADRAFMALRQLEREGK